MVSAYPLDLVCSYNDYCVSVTVREPVFWALNDSADWRQ